MSLPTFLLPNAEESSNFKSVFETITASAINIKGGLIFLGLDVEAKIKIKVQISTTLNFF